MECTRSSSGFCGHPFLVGHHHFRCLLHPYLKVNGGFNVEIQCLSLGLNAANNVSSQPLREQGRCVVHVQHQTDLMLLVAFGFDGLGSEALTLNPLHLNIAGFHQNTEYISAAVLDVGKQAFGVVMFPNGGGDLVHVCTGFRSKSSEVGGQFDALETVEVGFHLNGFNVQFFGQQVVEFTEVWASDDPSLSARQPLAAASVNADAAACFSQFSNEGHRGFKFKVLGWKNGGGLSRRLVPCIGRGAFEASGYAQGPVGGVNAVAGQVSVNAVHHER